MSTHTPGPWKLWVAQDARPHAVFLRHALGSIEIQHHGYIDTTGAIAKEQLCNARLIAASPELLKALQELVNVHSAGAANETIALDFWDHAKHAIAKATGGEA
jgi:hypothetical protein